MSFARSIGRGGAVQLAILVVLAWSASDARDRAAPADPSAQLADALLQVPEAQLNVSEAALRLSTLIVPAANPAQGSAMLDAIAARVAALVGTRTAPDFRIRAINTVLYRELGFAYDEVALKSLRAQPAAVGTLWQVLASRRGNCVSLPLLWYAIAERLHYPVVAVAAPQHLFLRYDDGVFRSNIEATSGGGAQTDEQLALDLEIPEAGVRSGAYLRSLSKRELLAVLIGEAAGPALSRGDVRRAIPLLERALRVDPRSVETRVQLARALQLEARRTGNPDVGRQARAHAQAATALGAAAPLKDDYWDEFVTRRLGERRAATTRPGPFDVVQWLERVADEDDRLAQQVRADTAANGHYPHWEAAPVARPPPPVFAPPPVQDPSAALGPRPDCRTTATVVEGLNGGARLEAPAGCASNGLSARELR